MRVSGFLLATVFAALSATAAPIAGLSTASSCGANGKPIPEAAGQCMNEIGGWMSKTGQGLDCHSPAVYWDAALKKRCDEQTQSCGDKIVNGFWSMNGGMVVGAGQAVWLAGSYVMNNSAEKVFNDAQQGLAWASNMDNLSKFVPSMVESMWKMAGCQQWGKVKRTKPDGGVEEVDDCIVGPGPDWNCWSCADKAAMFCSAVGAVPGLIAGGVLFKVAGGVIKGVAELPLAAKSLAQLRAASVAARSGLGKVAGAVMESAPVAAAGHVVEKVAGHVSDAVAASPTLTKAAAATGKAVGSTASVTGKVIKGAGDAYEKTVDKYADPILNNIKQKTGLNVTKGKQLLQIKDPSGKNIELGAMGVAAADKPEEMIVVYTKGLPHSAKAPNVLNEMARTLEELVGQDELRLVKTLPKIEGDPLSEFIQITTDEQGKRVIRISHEGVWEMQKKALADADGFMAKLKQLGSCVINTESSLPIPGGGGH